MGPGNTYALSVRDIKTEFLETYYFINQYNYETEYQMSLQILPGLQAFCIACAIAIAAIFILQTTWFVAWMTIDEMRIEVTFDCSPNISSNVIGFIHNSL